VKKLPDIIATHGTLQLWGLSIDKVNGLMVGTGDTPEEVTDPTPLVLFLKWSFDWNFNPEREKEIEDNKDIYTEPYWDKVEKRIKQG